MPARAATGVRDRAVYDVLMRHHGPKLPDLGTARTRVDEARAADDLSAQRAALVDEAAAAIDALEELPHPDDPAYQP